MVFVSGVLRLQFFDYYCFWKRLCNVYLKQNIRKNYNSGRDLGLKHGQHALLYSHSNIHTKYIKYFVLLIIIMSKYSLFFIVFIECGSFDLIMSIFID